MIYLFILREKKVVNIFFKKVELQIAFLQGDYSIVKLKTPWPGDNRSSPISSSGASFVVTWQRVPVLATLQGILSLEGEVSKEVQKLSGGTHSERAVESPPRPWTMDVHLHQRQNLPVTASSSERRPPGFLHLHSPVQISSTLTYLQRK